MLQLLNLAVCWLFCGVLNAHFAKKRSKNPYLWFVLGALFGLVALVILFILPKGKLKKMPFLKPKPHAKKSMPLAALKRTDAHEKRWYYLDAEHKQVGPMEFTDLTKVFKEKQVGRESFIWGEGMADWKKLTELPELEKEISAKR